MVYRTRNDVAKNLLMIQIFFEVGAFPIIKKMTAALTCTSMDMWCAIWKLTFDSFADECWTHRLGVLGQGVHAKRSTAVLPAGRRRR